MDFSAFTLTIIGLSDDNISNTGTSSEVIDTLIVPTGKSGEGFEDVFLNENAWYYLRISTSRLKQFKFIAAYQPAPISAVTHIAPIKEFVEVFFSEISEILVSGLDVKISGFGNFVLRDKKARPGRNPKTGEDVMISSRRVVTFRAGQKLKARVENNAISNE